LKIYKELKNGIKIVEYEPSFAQAIADMWVKCNDDWGGDVAINTPSQIISEHSSAANYNVFLALDGDAVVGYCSFARYYYDANTTYIPTLTVPPDYQGKGIGKALVLLCVERTIELGYPRTDLYTWAGNTAAVPLYKKCGYLWEDRPNSTHLTNFIPTVLKLFPDFFAAANWYQDSTRVLDVKPDGVMINEFECFGYTWAKDDMALAVGFERSGKQIRLVETQDYKVEFMAENHKLAYGLDYDCQFIIKNKTDKPLDIKIIGKPDSNISFDYQFNGQIPSRDYKPGDDAGLGDASKTNISFSPETGEWTIKGRFHVGAISEPQDIWRIHPCLSADISVDGTVFPFGLGIESCFPLKVDIHEECRVNQVGLVKDCYINIESTLPEDAIVQFVLSDNPLLDFASDIATPQPAKPHSLQVSKRGKASIKLPVKIKGIGYHALPMTYNITLSDGRSFSFEKPMHIINQDLTQPFSYEKDDKWGIANGPWRLEHNKNDNDVYLYHIMGIFPGMFGFDPPKFGKPYDDEFNLIKPIVKSYAKGAEMVMEAEYISGKFAGMAIVQTITLTASGVVTRCNRIENRGTSDANVMLNDTYWMPIGDYVRFMYQGKISTTMDGPWADGTPDGLESIDPELLAENWMFEADPNITRGMCWPKEYTPAIKWGNNFAFEIDPGKLAPGQSYETQPVVIAYGMFAQVNDFRNYALGLYSRKPLEMEYPIEANINGHNPFIGQATIAHDSGQNVCIKLVNNRSQALEGDVTVSSVDGIFEPQTQTNCGDEVTAGNAFDLRHKNELTNSLADGMALAKVFLDLTQYQKTYTRGMFFPVGEVVTACEDGVYTVSNGKITFKADPAYSSALFSLTTEGSTGETQWLESRYPNHEPYAWYNPFIGGIQTRPVGMNPMTAIKEKVTARFVEKQDNRGNTWKGICTTMTVNEHEALRGAVYETFYLTLPGLPLVCTFFQLTNNTGVFQEATESTSAVLRIADELTDVYINCRDTKRRSYRQRAGVAWQEAEFENVVKFSGTRPENMYVFHGNKLEYSGYTRTQWDNKALTVFVSHPVGVANGDVYTSKPTFLLVTPRDLPEGALDDLERVMF